MITCLLFSGCLRRLRTCELLPDLNQISPLLILYRWSWERLAALLLKVLFNSLGSYLDIGGFLLQFD